MTQYETAFLLSPNLEEEETEKIIGQMVEVVSKKKGKMINEDRWGKRKLAYPIKKFEEAFYVFFLYEGESDIPFELERRFKQSEAILRYLTVKKEPQKSIRRKKKAVSTEKDSLQEEMALEDEVAEMGTPDEERIEEEAHEEVKEAEEQIDATEEEEPAAKKKAASKKEKSDEEEEDVSEEPEEALAPDEKKVTAEKEEGAVEDAAPAEEEKEEE